MNENTQEKSLLENSEKTIFSKEDRKKQFRQIMGEVFGQEELEMMEGDLEYIGFFDAPASVNHHGNYEGGLFDHSLCVTNCLLGLTKRLELKWENKRSPYLVGMFHDLCKCDNYAKDENGEWKYNKHQMLSGHGDKSVIMLQQYIGLSEEEMLCIRWHMGAFDDSDMWKFYSKATREYPNVLYTHTADMLASQVNGI